MKDELMHSPTETSTAESLLENRDAPVIEAKPAEHEPRTMTWTRARTMSKAEVQALVDAYEIDSLFGLVISDGRGFVTEETHLLVATDRPRPAAAWTVPALTKAEAQALMDAHEIEPLLLDEVGAQLLLENNPRLWGAYTTIELIAKHGKSKP